MTLISVCMIVKNEAEMLPRALGNLDGFWDELIIVDTGSDDKTIAVAERLGATVLQYEMPEPGHLGAARNVSLEAARGKWVVVLDADEIISEPAKIRKFLQTPEGCDVTGVMTKVRNYDETGNVLLEWWQPRIWRRGMYRYEHRAHEVPIWCGDGAQHMVGLDVVFEHRPPVERKGDKTDFLLAMLEADVVERPDDIHSVYFMARQCALTADWERCIEFGQRYLELNHGVDNHDVYGTLATAYTQTDRQTEAIRMLHNGMIAQPHRRIWWIRMAEIYMQTGKWNIALAYLRGASELWPTFEWTTEVQAVGVGIQNLIDKCQNAMTSGENRNG